MAFLAPWMLLGMAAAAIPIILHLFFRSRYRRVAWAAMAFLRQSLEQTHRRLKFQEWLLLALRMALLLLLALAFARPFSRWRADAASPDQPVDAVFILDVSYSMSAREGQDTRLDLARRAALAALDQLPARSTVQILASADRTWLLGPRIPSRLDQARRLLEQGLFPSAEADGAGPAPGHPRGVVSLSTDHLPALRQAGELLRLGQSANKEVYLFSDMQRLGFERQRDALAQQALELSRLGTVSLVRCGQRVPRNATLLGIQPHSGIPQVGERAAYAVLVRNGSREPLRNLVVTLVPDLQASDKDSQTIAQLDPGEVRAISLTARFDRPGLHLLTAQLDGDDLAADNRYDQVILVRDQVRVLVVDGRPRPGEPEQAASYYLLHSLQPVPESARSKHLILPRLVSPREAAPALLADKDLAILVDVRLGEGSPEALDNAFLARLAEFVRSGRGLLLFAGDQVVAEEYNRILGDGYDLLPARLGPPASAGSSQPVHPDPARIEPGSFLAAFREEPLDRVAQVEVDKYLVAAPLEDAVVALRYSDGQPAVLRRKVGQGTVVLATTSADTTWTTWPILPTYLPFVHLTLSHLLNQQTQVHHFQAGQPLRWHPPRALAGLNWVLAAPDGTRTRLAAESTAGPPVVQYAATFQAGVYHLVPAQDLDAAEPATPGGQAQRPAALPASRVPFSVVPDLRESDNLDALTDAELDQLLGIRAVHVNAGDPRAFAGWHRHNHEWTRGILVAVLLAALAEAVAAWYGGRPR
jgi:hypothetical protein